MEHIDISLKEPEEEIAEVPGSEEESPIRWMRMMVKLQKTLLLMILTNSSNHLMKNRLDPTSHSQFRYSAPIPIPLKRDLRVLIMTLSKNNL